MVQREGGSLSPEELLGGESPLPYFKAQNGRPMGSRVWENSGLGEGQAWLHSLCPHRPAGEKARAGPAVLCTIRIHMAGQSDGWWLYFSRSAVS